MTNTFFTDRDLVELASQDAEILSQMPQDLTQITAEQDLACVRFFLTLSEPELRRRQDMCRQQQVMIQHDHANPNRTRAAGNLEVMFDQVTRAIDEQAFNRPCPRGTFVW